MQTRAIPENTPDSISAVMKEVFDASSAAFVIVDRKGLVSHANSAAKNMFGKDISGRKWLAIIKESFQPSGDDGKKASGAHQSYGKAVQFG